jgi:uncharacterized protein
MGMFLDGSFEGDMVQSGEFAPCLCWVLAMLLSPGFPYGPGACIAAPSPLMGDRADGERSETDGTTRSRDREMLGDPIFWIFVLPGLLLGAYAQSRIKINITKYSQVGTQDGITGAQVARRLLDSQGLRNVAVESTPGMLSDHYDPRSKTLRLSQGVYFAPSIAAAGIAAHEAGHALQDAVDYFPLEARTYIVPVVQLASQTAPWLFIAGVMLQLPTIAWVGVILFGASSVFALITLPVEFNASARAQELLMSHGIIRGAEQIAGVQKVLGAAAWTYVAAAVSAIGSWLFYVFVLLSQARSAGFRR